MPQHRPSATDTADVRPDWPQPPSALNAKRYAISINHEPGTPCTLCLAHTGEGPVGYFGEHPICDRCLDAADHDLSALLALVAIARIYVVLCKRDIDEAHAFLRPMLQDFGRATAHWGPPRLIWDPLNVPPTVPAESSE